VTELIDRLQTGLQQLWAVLPALLAAGLILLVGYFVARQIEARLQQGRGGRRPARSR
jgi:hypothetical protein